MSSTTTTLVVPRDPEATPSQTPSMIADEEALARKLEDVEGGNTTAEEEEPTAEVDESEYPQGMKMIFVVVALVLSIFLVALDMVCPSSPLATSSSTFREKPALTKLARPSSQPPSPRLQTNSAASISFRGTALLSS
jgi:hypothetical protein